MPDDTNSDSENREDSEETPPPMMGGGSVAPSGVLVLGDGDLILKLGGDEDTTFDEIVQCLHTEGRYFAQECVFFDEGDRVDQHIHHDSEEGGGRMSAECVIDGESTSTYCRECGARV